MNSIDLEVPIGKEKDQLTLPFGTLVNLGLFGNGVLRLKWVQMCHLQWTHWQVERAPDGSEGSSRK